MGGNNFKELMQNDEASGGQRFRNQFILLEKYESEYTDLSSSLKPNSETLTSLKIKIENLRESLKRPNEILVKFRELKNIASRDESILTSIEDKLGFLKLEKVKKQNPWQIISNPTIDNDPVAPNKKGIAIISFIFALITSTIIAKIKERKSGIIYNFESLKSLVNCDYYETIDPQNRNLNTQLIYKIKSNFTKKSSFKIGFLNEINMTQDAIINENLINKFFNFKVKEDILKIDFYNQESIEDCEKILLIIILGRCTIDDINTLNKLMFIYPDKFLGWLSIN